MKKTIFAILTLVLGGGAFAAAPNLFTYQGRLKESGQAITGNRTVEIFLCDAETAGTCHTTGAQGAAVSNGLFRSTFTVPVTVDFGTGSWWLELKVGADTLAPRERLSSNAYALFSATAAYAENIAAAAGAEAVTISSNVYIVGYSSASIYYGDGSALTGVVASGGVLKAGDTMTGPLTISGSTLAVIAADTQEFSLWASTSAVTPHLAVSTTGRVGIGAVSPTARLHVADTAPVLTLQDTDSSGTSAVGVLYMADSAGTGVFSIDHQGNTARLVNWVAGEPIAFLTNDGSGTNSRMTITALGPIGMGTSSPLARLDVVSTGTAADVMAQVWRDSAGAVMSSMSATGVLMASSFIGDGSGLTGVTAASAPGDSLGNHTATTTLQMGAYGVNTSSDITAARYQINGSTVLALLNGTGSFGGGPAAGRVNSGGYNTIFGYEAGYNNTTGEENSFLGYQAGYANTTGLQNTFLGSDAGRSNTDGWGGTFVGAGAGNANISGIRNTFAGSSAGYSNTAGSNNAFVGFEAGNANTAGHFNTFMGVLAGGYNTNGSENSFFGSQAGGNNTSGSSNTIVGYEAGFYNQTGTANTIVGHQAGGFLSGSPNSFSSATLMGYRAGAYLTSGLGNVLLGHQAGDSLQTGSRNIIIGYDADATAPTISDELNIGGVIRGNLADGTIGINWTLPGAALDIVSTGAAANVMAQVWRDSAGAVMSSMSATGVLMASRFIGDGSGLTGVTAASAPGDSLGSHIATQTITAPYGISGSTAEFSGSVTMGTVTITGNSGVYGLTVSSNVSLAGVLYTKSGFVGIGTSNPGALLEVSGGDVWAGTIKTTSIYGNATPLRLYTSSTERVTVDLAGKVGIGNAVPAEALDISDRVLVSTSVGGNADTDGILSKGLNGMTFASNNVTYLRVAYGGTNVAVGAGVTSGGGAALFQVKGSAAVGNSFSGSDAPSNGLIVEGRLGVGTASPGAKLEVTGGSVTLHGLGTQAYVLQAGDNGIVVSTGGAIQTTGVGHGATSGDPRGLGAVDLQTRRTTSNQVASGIYSTIAGGSDNVVSSSNSFIGGGYYNVVSGTASVIAGGELNSVSSALSMGMYAFVGGGVYNSVSNNYGVIGGGLNNSVDTAGNFAFIGGGNGNQATALAAVVPGGASNAADGDYSFAAGRSAASAASGAFTWADSEGTLLTNSTADRTWFKNRGGFLVTGSTQTISDGGLFVRGDGNVGVGTLNPGQAFEVRGGVRLNTAAAKPACDAASRGTIWMTQSALGAADTIEVCAKNAADTYGWYSLATIP